MVLDALWLGLLIKILATVSVVCLATIAVERAGPFWGGLLCGLPLTTGPGYVLLALQEDAGFVATSALASLAANIAVYAFLLAVVWLAPRRSALTMLIGAIACWALAALAIRPIAWTAATAALANLAALLVAGRLTRTVATDMPIKATVRNPYDLPIRALIIGVVIAGIVTASRAIGPSLTGIALVFPIGFASVTVVLHCRVGGRAVAATVATALRAVPGLAAAVLIVHVLAPVGVWLALTAGLTASIAWAGALMAWRAYARAAVSSAG
jgi:uncharacterized membrane protein (GlpM family)